MIARSPTGAPLLVHLRAEVMHRSYPILGDTLRRIEYLTTHTSIADLASIILQDQGFTAIVLQAAVGIVLRAQPDFGEGVPAEGRLAGARERLREVAMLATQSLPNLSAALHEVELDDLWRAARAERRAQIAAQN